MTKQEPRSEEKEWMEILTDLWSAFDKPVDQKRFNLYVRNLSFIPLGLLKKVIPLAIQQQRKYNLVPTVGNVIAALEQTLGDPPVLLEAIEEWCRTKAWKNTNPFPDPA
jgi:hypothetical protein